MYERPKNFSKITLDFWSKMYYISLVAELMTQVGKATSFHFISSFRPSPLVFMVWLPSSSAGRTIELSPPPCTATVGYRFTKGRRSLTSPPSPLHPMSLRRGRPSKNQPANMGVGIEDIIQNPAFELRRKKRDFILVNYE